MIGRWVLNDANTAATRRTITNHGSVQGRGIQAVWEAGPNLTVQG